MLCGFYANISLDICALCLLNYKLKVLGKAYELTYSDACQSTPLAKE
jgi:hypothetical protein